MDSVDAKVLHFLNPSIETAKKVYELWTNEDYQTYKPTSFDRMRLIAYASTFGILTYYRDAGLLENYRVLYEKVGDIVNKVTYKFRMHEAISKEINRTPFDYIEYSEKHLSKIEKDTSGVKVDFSLILGYLVLLLEFVWNKEKKQGLNDAEPILDACAKILATHPVLDEEQLDLSDKLFRKFEKTIF